MKIRTTTEIITTVEIIIEIIIETVKMKTKILKIQEIITTITEKTASYC